MKRLSDFIIAIVIFIIGVAIFTGILWRGFAPSEAKLALYAQYILQHGWSWIGQAYAGLQGINFSTVPTLAFLSAAQFGHLTVFAAVVPSAIASGITLGFTYLLGALRNRSWGLMAVFLVLGTQAFFLTSRSLSFAPFITAIVTISIYCVVEFEKQWFWLYLTQGILFFLGFIVEGTVGLLLPAIAVWLYLIWRGQFKKFIYQVAWAIIIFIVGMALLLFAASSQGGSTLVHHVISGQLQTLVPKASWAWTPHDWLDLLFYIIALPLAIITIILRWHQLIWPKAGWEIQFLRFLAVWSLVMIVITIFWGWRPNFMLPMTPALGLVGAYIFNKEHLGKITISVRKILLLLFALVPIAALILIIIAFAVNYFKNNAYTPFYLHCFILLILLSVLTIFFFLKRRETIQERSFAVMLFAAITFVIVNVGVVEQINASHNKVTLSTEQFDKALKDKPGQLVFYNIPAGSEDMLLMVNLGVDQTPVFTSQSDDLANETKMTYVVLRQSDYTPLQTMLSAKYKTLLKGDVAGKALMVLQYIKPAPKPAPKKTADKKDVAVKQVVAKENV